MTDTTDVFLPHHYLEDTKTHLSVRIKESFTAGRKAEFQVPEEDVSSNHCLFTMRGVKLDVTDLDSTNGTYINNRKLMKGEVYTLKNGDRIRIGTKRVFVYSSEKPSDGKILFELLTLIKKHWWVYLPLVILTLMVGMSYEVPDLKLSADLLFLKPYAELTPPWTKLIMIKFIFVTGLIFLHAYAFRLWLTEEKFPKAWVTMNFFTFVVVLVLAVGGAKKVGQAYVKYDPSVLNFQKIRTQFLTKDLHQSYYRRYIQDYSREHSNLRRLLEEDARAQNMLALVHRRDIQAMLKKYDNPYYRDVYAELLQIQ